METRKNDLKILGTLMDTLQNEITIDSFMENVFTLPSYTKVSEELNKMNNQIGYLFDNHIINSLETIVGRHFFENNFVECILESNMMSDAIKSNDDDEICRAYITVALDLFFEEDSTEVLDSLYDMDGVYTIINTHRSTLCDEIGDLAVKDMNNWLKNYK